MNRLLVNADDFGLHGDIDDGIVDCIRFGSVCSLSFSPNGKSINWPRIAALQAAGVKVGLHLTLVGEPWLTDNRIIPAWKQLALKLLTPGQRFRADLAREIESQFAACEVHKISLDHVDSHQHVHVFAGVWRPLLAAARLRKIPRIRVPWAPAPGAVKRGLGGHVLQSLAKRRRHDEPNALPCIGLAHAGHNTTDILINELRLAATAAADLELVAHPARDTAALQAAYPSWHFDWHAEHNAITSDQFTSAVRELSYEIPRVALPASA
jgi:chitin disaccharide deacetylase